MVSISVEEAMSKSSSSPDLLPTITTLSPGKKEQHNAYPHSRVRRTLPVLMFQIFKLPLDAVASIRSSELRAKDRTSVRCPGRSTANDLLYSAASSALLFFAFSFTATEYSSTWLFVVETIICNDLLGRPPAQSMDRTLPPVLTITYGTKTSETGAEATSTAASSSGISLSP